MTSGQRPASHTHLSSHVLMRDIPVLDARSNGGAGGGGGRTRDGSGRRAVCEYKRSVILKMMSPLLVATEGRFGSGVAMTSGHESASRTHRSSQLHYQLISCPLTFADAPCSNGGGDGGSMAPRAHFSYTLGRRCIHG